MGGPSLTSREKFEQIHYHLKEARDLAYGPSLNDKEAAKIYRALLRLTKAVKKEKANHPEYLGRKRYYPVSRSVW